MKITKRQLRRLVRESMADFGQKFDAAYRQPDGSYSGHPDEEPEDSWYSDQDETFADDKYRVAQEEDEVHAEDLGGMHDEFEEEELAPLTQRDQELATSPMRSGMGRRFESRTRGLTESVADMANYQDLIGRAAAQLSDNFYEDMMSLFEEEPEAFEGRSSRMEWEEQVVYAQQQLDTGIASAIEDVIAQIEMELHDGQFAR